jgi:ferric-dicitrate binding protein FerR (iron transport regulator)
MTEGGYMRRAIALFLCFLMSPLPALCQQPQQAGDLAGVNPAATRNGTDAHVKDTVFWNDRLKTDRNGRVRVALKDGSALSLGSESELQVIQHDAASQQTTLQILLGRIRAQVVKLTTPTSKFEVNTPHATLGVIGTDFHVSVTNDSTTVIVYSGIVRVTPLHPSASNPAPGQAETVTVTAGHMVQVTASGIGPLEITPTSLIQASVTNTFVAGTGSAATTAAVAGSHVLRNVLIGLGVAAAGAVAGVVVAKKTSSGKGPSIPAQ